MREERETFDLIEKYLQGKLSQEESALVEDRMANDLSFAEEVQTSAQVNTVVMGAAMDLLREQMTKDITGLETKNKFKWWTGSLVVLLALTSAIYLYVKKDYSPEKTLTKDTNQSPVVNSKMGNGIIQKETGLDSDELKNKKDAFILDKQEEMKELTVSPVDNTSLPSDKDAKNKDPQENSPAHIQHAPQVLSDNKVKGNLEKCKISFRPVVHATCRGEAVGSIEVDSENIEGGKAPYIFTMDHTGIESGSGYFKALAEGSHLITVKDNLGCTASQEVNIPGKHCQTQKSFAINPDLNETWKIPFTEGESGKFTILNKGGIVIFKGNFGSSELNEWNGTDVNGATAAIGIHVCILEYTNGKTENIQITIIR